MKFNLLQLAASAAFFASISQLPASVSAAAVQEHVVQEREVAHPLTKPTDEEAEAVALRVHFGPKDKRLVKVATPVDAEDIAERIHFNPLVKRKGGGGGGKGGGGGGGGGKSSGGKSGGGKVPSTHRGSSYGYKTYGGRYGGGASAPYRAGGTSKLGLVPFLLPLAAIALIFPGIWLWGVYAYNYHTTYTYYNQTLGRDQTVPIQCLCQKFSDCACDDDGDVSYLGELIALNQSNTTIFNDVNGVWTLLINGTVQNGTGEIFAGDTSNSSALEALGYIWMVGVAVWMAYSM